MIGQNVLLIFCKYPEEGKVKTRLAKSIGDKKATQIYKFFVEYILKNVESDQYEIVVFATPKDKIEAVNNWLGEDVNVLPQSGKDLGEKLNNAFKAAFIMGASRVIVVGTDNPLLDNNLIEQAFEGLDSYDFVIGPSVDGGYYLLGMNQMHSEVFRDIDWSTEKVFHRTIEKMDSLGLACEAFKEALDVDEEESLLRLCSILEHKHSQPELFGQIAKILKR